MAVYSAFQPRDHYESVTYTGTSSGAKTVTGVNFQPDNIWFKLYSGTYAWACLDSLRGVTSILELDNTGAAATNSNYLASFDSGGFTTTATQDTGTNSSGGTYMAYSWKAGTTSGITTDGSTTITPNSYSFNQTGGFSIINFDGNETSGAGIPHGLGVAPDAVIVKAYAGPGGADAWNGYNVGAGNTYRSGWDRTAIPNTGAGYWNNTTPDSVNVYLGNDGSANGPNTYTAYCFAQKSGFSKFGKYKGTGSGSVAAASGGANIYCGFRPAFVVVKGLTAIHNWVDVDKVRQGYNHGNYIMHPNTTGGSYASDWIDIMSWGFKTVDSDSNVNNSAQEYLYWAWAEFPTVSSNGMPVVAR